MEKENSIESKGEIVLYQPDANITMEVRLEQETVWLTQAQMVELFKSTKQNISLIYPRRQPEESWSFNDDCPQDFVYGRGDIGEVERLEVIAYS